jgi:hypothetical protein
MVLEDFAAPQMQRVGSMAPGMVMLLPDGARPRIAFLGHVAGTTTED